LNTMTTTLKSIISVKLCVWWKVSKGILLDIIFLRIVNMQLAKKEVLGAWKMLPLNVPKFEFANQNKVKCKLFVLVLFSFYCFEFLYSKMLPSQ
jgi:hypothetical protein